MTDGINHLVARAGLGQDKVSLNKGNLNKSNMNIEELHLTVGQKITVQVIAREGELYLLRLGSASFLAKADAALAIEEWVDLVVEGSRDNIVLLKKTTVESRKPDDNIADNPLRIILEKYGVTGEQDMNKLQSLANSLPLHENTVVRCLLDPNLAAMLLLPEPTKQGYYQKVEIRRHPGNNVRPEDYWEVIIALEPENLGRLEINVLLTPRGLSARIWAREESTEEMLRERCRELDGFCVTEIIPSADRPLLSGDEHEFIDVSI